MLKDLKERARKHLEKKMKSNKTEVYFKAKGDDVKRFTISSDGQGIIQSILMVIERTAEFLGTDTETFLNTLLEVVSKYSCMEYSTENINLKEPEELAKEMGELLKRMEEKEE